MDAAESRDVFDKWVDSTLFQSIPAVKAGRVVYLESDDRKTLRDRDGKEIAVIGHPGVSSDDPIGTPRFADAIAPLIAEVLKAG